jgi:hypothetical protein
MEYEYEIASWNVKSSYTGSLVTVSKEQVTWNGGTELAGEYTYLYGKGNENHELGTGSLCIKESHQQLRRLSLLATECHT